ncbi:Membrane protein involved in the export of O-antigen and teichoic acid [Mesorhizobium albiziae]|uniref:Membrane protein involved in the export of O-antigen and teichoic acid n=1 Tax=Neomesorhizobium albiziae TaxID=335020 RepID=A0A1I4B4P1_9HYPH|nr:lipopolysaccharide biosynthesis protein [Mesorhizobium albiziae]SFK63872.1 Membrane protein involved in the export of O-antigen and teichoic acid [Mesorhizobium albiziae]
MSETGETTQSPKMGRIRDFLASRRSVLRDYFTAISGSAGRLVFSLVYFIALANTLSIADFGLFATASAAGVMLSRILSFGFISALYRVATVRPNLIGVFTGGFLLLGLLSLPVLALAGWLVFALFFAGDLGIWIFATVVFAEALLWRPVEVVVIVNNGMGKFGRAAILVIMGTVLRAAAALAFIFWPKHDLAAWSSFYIAANGLSFAIAFGFFYPRQRLRFRPELYWRRLADSIYVAGAEVLFYLQMEFDKLLVLSIGGPHLAGIYAIVMRLVDLTAIPIRTFTMMLVQKMMRTPEMLARFGIRAGIESGVFAISTLALGALAVLLYFFPRALGGNVSEAAPLVGLALLVPAFRNLVEYHAELLFARGQTLIRAFNLALLAGFKGMLLWWALTRLTDTAGMVLSLNLVFAALYLASAMLTYTMLRWPAKTF